MLPLTTTTITIHRLASGVDPYESENWATVATRQPATISNPSGASREIGGDQQTVSATLYTDGEVDLRHEDHITDETTGLRWRVTWVTPRYELGLSHIRAGIERTVGASNEYVRR